MAKKKQGKKHKFKYATPVVPGQAAVISGPSLITGQKSAVAGGRSMAAHVVPGRDFSYVAVDLRKILIIAACLVALEFIIWFLFAHTGLGPSVYQMVQV